MAEREIILDFIDRFKGSEEVFLHGCCYWFAHILNDRFWQAYETDVLSLSRAISSQRSAIGFTMCVAM